MPTVAINTTPSRVFYYGCQGVDDTGWGCVYRSGQTLMFAMGYHVPHIMDMVDTLHIPRDATGRSRWIEPHDLRTYLPGFHLLGLHLDRKRMLRTHIQDFSGIASDWHQFHDQILHHLLTLKAPVVVDDGVVGQCISGFYGDSDHPEDGRYVVIDPHVTQEGKQVRLISVRTFYESSPMLMALIGHDPHRV